LDVENKIRIEVPKVEYNSVGFSGSWVDAYSLVDTKLFKKMTNKGPGTLPNTVWYEQKNERGTTKILWDEKNKISLLVEVNNKEGTIKKSSKVELVSQNATNPLFTKATTFTMKVISDYRD
jgi:hypothetical protein